MICDMLSKVPSMSKKSPNITTFVLLFVVNEQSREVSGDSLVDRQIGIKVEDTHQKSGPYVPGSRSRVYILLPGRL